MSATPQVEPAGPPRHTPAAGWERVRAVLGDRVPRLTDEDRRKARELVASLANPADQMPMQRDPITRTDQATDRPA